MSATYNPTTAFTYANYYTKDLPLSDVKVRILDEICSMIWMAAPWRWTLGSMTAFTVVANTQDYTVTLPSDFLYAVDAYIASGSDVQKNLVVEPSLPSDVKVVGEPTKISFTGTPGGSGTARLMPKPGTVASTAPQVISLYKKQAPKITSGNSSTAGVLVMDDEWFYVYESGVLWLAYLYADDPRAGAAQATPDGKVQYTGQRAIFESNLLDMKARERLPLMGDRAAPEGRGERK